MKLSDFYKLAVKLGIERDPRRKKSIRHYADTAILYGLPKAEVKKILVGIDIDTGELLLADNLRRKQGLDLVVSHHPQGKAYAALYEVMQLQVELLAKLGIAHSVAQALLKERQQEVARKVLPANHMRAVDAARLLDLPFICMHTPADNHAAYFIERLLRKERPKKVQDIINLLMDLAEFKEAKQNLAGPRIILGSPRRPVGKIFVEMTGGTEGPRQIYSRLYKKGVRTLVCMHLSEEHFKSVKDADLNVVISGHISSDTLGLNLLLDRIEQESAEELSIVACSGFRRHKREP